MHKPAGVIFARTEAFSKLSSSNELWHTATWCVAIFSWNLFWGVVSRSRHRPWAGEGSRLKVFVHWEKSLYLKLTVDIPRIGVLQLRGDGGASAPTSPRTPRKPLRRRTTPPRATSVWRQSRLIHTHGKSLFGSFLLFSQIEYLARSHVWW